MTPLLVLFWVLVGAWLALFGVWVVLVVQWRKAYRDVQRAARPTAHRGDLMSHPHARTRVTVPVIAPTEWIQYRPEHAVQVAEWLAERGVQCELHFGRGSGPTLWRPSSVGRNTVEPGQWVGVQVGGGAFRVADDGELDDGARYRNVSINVAGAR